MKIRLTMKDDHILVTIDDNTRFFNYKHKLDKSLFDAKSWFNENNAVDYFAESLMYNENIMKELKEKFKLLLISNSWFDKVEPLIRLEVWHFDSHYFTSQEINRFFISNLEVTRFKLSQTTTFFYLNNPWKTDGYRYITTYGLSYKASAEEVLEAFLFGLKYEEYGDTIILYILNEMCKRDDEWVKKYGL
jgi:hypothetical protein